MFADVTTNWRASLNPSQHAAVTADDGPVLVIAGAGTGKTWTLACRVAHLIENGTPPERILLLTFSRRAAREMLSRADRLLARRDSMHRVWGGTFHAIANRLLRLHGRAVGLPADFTVLDQSDMADLIDLVRGDHFPPGARDKTDRRFPRKDTLAAIYSRMVNAEQPLSAVLEAAFPWCVDDAAGIRSIFAEFTRRKQAANVLDYDDLLLYWRALGETPAGRSAAQAFDHVLVDEYQDTNPLQAHILRALRATSGNIMVVGDDAQAIYGFRAASVRNILDFPVHFPGAQRITLDQNYRSTGPILDVSNAVIAQSRERFPKDLWPVRSGGARPRLVTCTDEPEQCRDVCDRILEHREQGIPLKQQVVLFRTGHHSDLLELELARRNIPFVKFGGLKFLESAHIKDLLALLRILENPRDEVSWFRVLQLLDGIGPASARAILQTIGLHAPSAMATASIARAEPMVGTSLTSVEASERPARASDPLERFLAEPPRVPEAARTTMGELRAAWADCHVASTDTPLPPAVEIARLRQFCEPIFLDRYSSPQARLHDLDQLEAVASNHASRGRFLADLALDPPTSTSDLAGPPLLDEDYVVLSTIHSAKGGEWDVVHVIHAADGMIPSDMSTGDADAIEEERRLFYVALTRARDALYVYFSLRYYRRPRGLDDTHHYAQVTRFLPAAVQDLFDRTRAAVPDPAPQQRAAGQALSVDGLLAGLWDH